MRKLCTLILALFIILSGAEVFAVQKVSKKSNKDSTKAKTSVKADKKSQNEKKPIKQQFKSLSMPQKDRFIDRDGDGINDDIKIRKAPEVKKERIPKVKERKPSKPVEKKVVKNKETEKKSKKSRK